MSGGLGLRWEIVVKRHFTGAVLVPGGVTVMRSDVCKASIWLSGYPCERRSCMAAQSSLSCHSGTLASILGPVPHTLLNRELQSSNGMFLQPYALLPQPLKLSSACSQSRGCLQWEDGPCIDAMDSLIGAIRA